MQNGRSGLLDGARNITGPGSAALKYDILTALLVTAAQGEATEARLALRLSLLITARFNSRSGTFSVGRREMARMWGVTERTAKREIAEMRARGWIAVHVPAARGRVAQYRIELPRVLAITMPHWQAVGPDFAARMVAAPDPAPEASNVVPLRREAALPEEDGSGWARAAAQLQAQDPAVWGAWFAPLVPVGAESGILTLLAPSRFLAEYVTTHYHSRLLAAVSGQGVREVRVTCE